MARSIPAIVEVLADFHSTSLQWLPMPYLWKEVLLMKAEYPVPATLCVNNHYQSIHLSKKITSSEPIPIAGGVRRCPSFTSIGGISA
jgi:hypothetical protein